MKAVPTALAVGAIVVVGKWARGQGPNIDNAIGVAGIAIGLAIIEQINEQIAGAFSVLILLSLAIVHGPTVLKAAGLIK